MVKGECRGSPLTGGTSFSIRTLSDEAHEDKAHADGTGKDELDQNEAGEGECLSR